MELRRPSHNCEFGPDIIVVVSQTSSRIIFRALQGVGGAGVYAVDMAIFFELVPPESFPTYASIVSTVYAVSLLLGPILGGQINDDGVWRWVFLLK